MMTTVLWCILFSSTACFWALSEGEVKGRNMWNYFGQNQNCPGKEETSLVHNWGREWWVPLCTECNNAAGGLITLATSRDDNLCMNYSFPSGYHKCGCFSVQLQGKRNWTSRRSRRTKPEQRLCSDCSWKIDVFTVRRDGRNLSGAV